MDSKRSLPSDSRDTIAAKKTKANSSHTTTKPHKLARALRFGVFSFLTTRDAAMLLNCCKAFRSDSALAKSALLAGPSSKYASHFLHDCKLDWFSLDPTRYPIGCENKSYCCPRERSGKSNHDSSTMADATTRPQANAQLVSLVAMLEASILGARPKPGHCVSSYGDPVCAVPVAISLWEHHPDKSKLQPDHDWTRDDVRLALNAVDDGFGDRFADVDPAKVRGSELGAHWENIRMNESGEVACLFCDKWKNEKQRKNLLPFPKGPVWENVDLSEAISKTYGFRKVCRAYARPLKRSLLKSFKFANRIKYPRLGTDYNSTCCADIDVELLAGVSSTGFLCGSLFVRYENP